MIGIVRIVAWLLMLSGGLVLVGWAFEPLRAVWPWLLGLPLPVRIGIAVATLGFLILMGTLLYERLQDREQDGSLRDE